MLGVCTLLTVCVCVGGEGGADESVRGGVSIGEDGADDESLAASERANDCELGDVVYKSKMSVTAGETGEQMMVAVTEDPEGPDIDAIAWSWAAREVDMTIAERRGEPVSKSTSSSPTSRGTGLAKNRVLPDDSPGELEFSRSLNTNPSPVESHSAVNVHEVSREDFGGGGLTIGELGRFRWTPLNRATLRRIFLTLPEPEGCALPTACEIARGEDPR